MSSSNYWHSAWGSWLVCLLVAAGTGTGCSRTAPAPEPRATFPATIPLNSGWEFYRYENNQALDLQDLPVSGWQAAVLPHSARIEPRIVNDQWQGDAVYKRVLFAEPSWAGQAVWLRFEGAMMTARVFLNGQLALEHQGGYLPFTVDLSRKLQFGKDNEILVHLDNRDNPLTGPKPLAQLDFSMYGGLYREVNLLLRDSLHISDEMLADSVAGGGNFVRYPEINQHRAQVSVKTHVRNTGKRTREFTVSNLLLNDKDVIVAKAASDKIALAPGSSIHSDDLLNVASPRLWSPRSPNLYRLLTSVEEGGQVIDQRETRIGIRTISIKKGKFEINGEQIFLRGVNRHQEYPYVGYALSPQADYRDAKLIKEAGFDYVRLSHYPHSRHFMAAADELGLVLLDAILGWQYFNPAPEFSEYVVQSCRNLIRRDRNHPSVIAWECSLNESAMPASLIARLHRTVHEEYPGPQAYSAGWTPDGYDIYLQARQHRLQHYEAPDRPYIVSEYGDWEYYAQNAGLKQDAWEGLKEEERSSRQLLSSGEKRLLQQATNIQEAHNDNLSTPAFADGYWVMFDYNRGYADDLEASGVMSIDRVAKPAYYFFKSQRDADETSELFSSGPMVKIASDWMAGSASTVRVFSNAKQVALHLNGKLVAKQAPDDGPLADRLRHPPFTFSLPAFDPGRLEAVAYIDDREVARDIVRTPGPATELRLALSTENVSLGKNDLVFVRASLRDKHGSLVPVSARSVAFEIECETSAAEFPGGSTAASEAGIASALLRIANPNSRCIVSAKSGALTAALQLPVSRPRAASD